MCAKERILTRNENVDVQMAATYIEISLCSNDWRPMRNNIAEVILHQLPSAFAK